MGSIALVPLACAEAMDARGYKESSGASVGGGGAGPTGPAHGGSGGGAGAGSGATGGSAGPTSGGFGGAAGWPGTSGAAGAAGAAGSAGSAGGAGSAGAAGASGAAGSSGSAGAAGAGGATTGCEADNACATAMDLGAVRGDEGADIVQVKGHTSSWLKVRIGEADHDVFGEELAFTVTLQSPSETDFELLVYITATSVEPPQCSVVARSSSNPLGQDDSATMSWGEGPLANNADDSRWVTIEVRHVSGSCAPTDEWTLSVQGNT
jgi:pilus assembly protein FimV